ncbi:ankyrin repeat protein [Colletotrichum acutatum]
MGIPNESIIPLYQNHRDMCRFSGETSSYKLVFEALRGIALDCQSQLNRNVTSKNSSEKSFGDSEKSCMTLLSVFDLAEYKLLLPKPTEGTCQWILRHSSFASWISKTESHILWLTGHPGCGKTTISFFIAQHFETSFGPSAPYVYVYFCDDKVKRQRDGKSILIGLIYQILCRRRSMIRHVKKVFDQQGTSMVQSFSALWGIFEDILNDPKSGSVFIIVDALDECEDDTCRQFLDSVHALVRTLSFSNSSAARVKFLLTSRPALRQTLLFDWDDTVDVQSSISIDGKESGYTSDLLAFIESKLLLASSRPLNLGEINVAFTIRSDHRTSASVEQDSQNAILLTIQGVLGPLVRVSDNTVSLIHQTAKEFLLRPIHLRDALFPIPEITVENSALRMASACISFLLLDDFSRDLAVVGHSGSGTPSSESRSDGIDSPVSKEVCWLEEDTEIYGSDTLFKESGALDAEVCHSMASRYPFYRYASLNWASHFAVCETLAPIDLSRAVEQLLNADDDHCVNWLRFFHQDAATMGFVFPSIMDTLTIASSLNLYELVNRLIKKRNCWPQQSLDQAIFLACQAGYSRIVSRLLDEAASPNLVILDRQTALTVAAEQGQLGCIKALLAKANTNVNARGRSGRTAMSFACGNGHLDIVNYLLGRHDCIIDETDNAGSTPLFWAVGGSHLIIISILLKQPKTNVNHRDKAGRTSLSWAAGDGMEKPLKELLKIQGIEADLKDAQGRSPLSWAAGNGHADLVRILLKSKKVDIGSVDRNGRNAISWASVRGHLHVLRVLLQDGCAGIDDEDVDGWTPLAWAVHNDCPDFVETLASTESVDIEHRDRTGKSILYWAVSYGHISVVKVLLRLGADPKAASLEGLTPLMAAESSKRSDILIELLRAIEGTSSTVCQ